MPRNGERRYLYPIRGWLDYQRPSPEECLGVSTYVEIKERPHESGWQFLAQTKDSEAIELAMDRYGTNPSA